MSEGRGPGVRGLVPLAAWCAALVVAATVVHGAGDGALSAPPLTPTGWIDWLDRRHPLVAVVAVARLATVGFTWYLLSMTVAGVAARIARRDRLARVAHRCSPPVLRRLVRAAVGASVASALVTGWVPGAAADVGVTSREVVAIGPAFPAIVASAPVSSVASGPTSHVAAGTAAAGRVGLGPLPLRLVDPAGRAGERREHVVVAGDSMWSIAADLLRRDLGRPPTDAEVTPAWVRMLELNRDRLVHRDVPDLIFPGQRLALPEIDVAG